jgi:ubiquinone/menaquinone biosynthesis C-methylase UbiE
MPKTDSRKLVPADVSAKDYDTVIGRSHLTGYQNWPPPADIFDHLNVFARFIEDKLGGGSILDLGCGDGSIARIIAERSGTTKITGVDLEAHEQWGIDRPKNLKFHAASIDDLSFKPKSFDFVMMKDVLHHLPDPEKTLREVSLLAKKKVLIIEANRYNPISYIRMVKIAKHEHFSRKKLKNMIDRPHELYTYETHVWPSKLKVPGKVIDTVFSLPVLSRLRNYNIILFEP